MSDTGPCPALNEYVSFLHSLFVWTMLLLLLLLLLSSSSSSSSSSLSSSSSSSLSSSSRLSRWSPYFRSFNQNSVRVSHICHAVLLTSRVHTSVFTKTKLPTVKDLVNWDTRLLSSKNRNPKLRLYIELKNVLKQKCGLQTFFSLASRKQVFEE